MKETKNGGMNLNKKEWEFIVEKEKLLCAFIHEWIRLEDDDDRIFLVNFILKQLYRLMNKYKDTLFE